MDQKHFPDEIFHLVKHKLKGLRKKLLNLKKDYQKNQDKNLKLISKTLGIEQQELIPFSTITKVGKQEIYNKLMEEIEL